MPDPLPERIEGSGLLVRRWLEADAETVERIVSESVEHLRPWMTGRFREVLASQNVPWVEVRGDRAERLRHALAAVDAILAAGWGLAPPLG